MTRPELARVVASLSEAPTLDALCDLAARELVDALGFDRGGVYLVREERVVPAGLALSSEHAEGLRALMATPTTLRELPAEQHMLRRGAAAIVDPRREAVYRPFVDLCASPEYVGAPMLVGGRPVGFILADLWRTRRRLAARDRDELWGYAAVVGLAVAHRVACDRIAAAREALAGAGEPAAGPSTDTPFWKLYGLLTRRELEVLPLLAEGRTTHEIADALGISHSTAKTHLANVLRKLKARNRTDAVRRALEIVSAARDAVRAA